MSASSANRPQLDFPNGKRFAFSIIDDTDGATVENSKPFYDLLERLGMRATKTVWPLRCPEGSKNFSSSQTLEDEEYLAFVLGLQRRGFEITWHGATMESSTRERTLEALERFRNVFGHYPRIHPNHAQNRENLYWGLDRIDQPLLKFLLARPAGQAPGKYVGHVEGSPYWWGDLCLKHIHYVRNLTYGGINLARINPSMPYFDPSRPLAARWFSASDADCVTDFLELLSDRSQQRLEEEGGFCIVATHVGKGYVQDSKLYPGLEECLGALARRPGWFPTVSELLDWLAGRQTAAAIPPSEWRRMQWRWAWDLALRRARQGNRPWHQRLDKAVRR